MTADPRDSYAYKKLRRAFLLQHQRTRGACDKCGRAMDYRGKRPIHRLTATVEHRLPVETHPEHALDSSLWQAWCLSCNSAGNRNRRTGPVVPPPIESRW